MEINTDKQRLWDFISDPRNLAKITPKHMGFKILTAPLPDTMYPGLMIHYKLSPIPGFKTHWLTEITHVKDLEYFVDEQRHGPYSIWHHEHFIEEVDGKLIMRDILHYKLPFGWIGRLLNSVFISKKIDQIFIHRKAALDNIFH